MSSFSWEIRNHPRARHLRITVYANCRIIVTAPSYVSSTRIATFVKEKTPWIERQLARLKKFHHFNLPSPPLASYGASKQAAREHIEGIIAKYRQIYPYSYKRLSVKNHRSKWGSCSVKGNLNFNYRLLFLPPRLSEYIVIHELCHLIELNHSSRFWALVGRSFPDYRQLRKTLRHIPL